MKIEPVTLPEFGLDLNWAMCRNPMCANFGLDVEVEIPPGDQKQKTRQASDARHRFETETEWTDYMVGRCVCRYCGAQWNLHSNHAVRVIGRYFLSLSMPFADCGNPACVNYGKNVYECWTNRRSASRPYRRERAHMVRCRGCGKIIPLGTSRFVRIKHDPELSPRQRPPPPPEWFTRLRWQDIIAGLYATRSITDTYEQYDISPGNYYSTLRRIGGRLRDYHAFRNARLLRPGNPAHDRPVRVHTDVLQVSLQAFRKNTRHKLLDVIVSVMAADRKLFVLAAHPCFLPDSEGPEEDALAAEEERPMFQREWASVLHADTPKPPSQGPDEAVDDAEDVGRGGHFINPPYAQLAHFLVVQKMLGRFREIHCYMDGARDLSKAAMVAFRERILAGGAVVTESGEARPERPRSAEIVLYQHETSTTVRRGGRRPRRGKPLDRAWAEAEKRFEKKVNPPDELPLPTGEAESKVRADKYRFAFHGGFSGRGNWAWLRYPRDSAAYRNCRTLWATRMPTKTFESHGEAVLTGASLQPVDAIMNSMRSRVRPVARPLLSAAGRSYRSNYVIPAVMFDEMSVYLLRQNYDIRRKTSRPVIPASTWGLLLDDEPRLDVTDCAWNFQLGVEHAELISRWLRA